MNVEKIDAGSRIRAYRTRKGMTLTDLSVRTGIAASTLSSIELGKSSPTLHTLLKIAAAFGVRVGTLLNDVLYTKAVLCGADEARHPEEIHEKHTIRRITPDVFLNRMEASVMTLTGECTPIPACLAGEDRLVFCLSGEARLVVDNEAFFLSQGDSVYLLAEAEAVLGTRGQSHAVLLVVRTIRGRECRLGER